MSEDGYRSTDQDRWQDECGHGDGFSIYLVRRREDSDVQVFHEEKTGKL